MGNVFANCFTFTDHEQSSSSPADRISDLPDDILRLILSFLPFKSVGQTSVLSRRWNEVWSSYPIIDFYEMFTSSESDNQQFKTRIINTVLASNNEEKNDILYPCLKISPPSIPKKSRVSRRCVFGLGGGSRPNKPEHCLSRVEEVVLDIRLNTTRRSNNSDFLPQCQLKCHSRSSCGNSKPWLGFPSSYLVGSFLRSLHTLSLTDVNFSDSTRALGVDFFSGSSFPSLEKLELQSCRGRKDLKICCPNLKHIKVYCLHLKSLDISGMRLDRLDVWFCFDQCINGSWVNINAPNLQSFFWDYSGIAERFSIQTFPTLIRSSMSLSSCWIVGNKINNDSVVDLLSALSRVRDFDICCDYLQILSNIYFESGCLPFSFMNLKTLTIRHGMSQRHIPGLACLLKSSPGVHCLEVWFFTYGESLDAAKCTQEEYWESQVQYLSPFLCQLKKAKIRLGQLIPESAITFAKFVLKHGKNLQEMSVSWNMSKSSLPPSSLSDTIALLEGFPRACRYTRFSTLCY